MSEIDELHPDLRSLVGSVIHERYRVDELLGRGGMGAVFKGYHLNLHRGVAIKVLRPEVGRDAGMSARFTREAHSVSRLDHPNCVRVSDFGTTDGGVRYLVMELLEGEELQASLGQPWSADRAIDVAMQILDGLDHAHHCGVVHRDLKPENVFVTVDFRGNTVVKLVDFGIAKLLDDEDPSAKLTREGMVFGTPRYMSPEQATGGKLDARTDLYAVGLLLYEMLAGHPPFQSDDAGALLRMHILAPPPELPPTVPPALAAVVSKLLEKSRGDRPASAREAIEALEQVRASLVSAAASNPAAGQGSAALHAPAVPPAPQAAQAHAPLHAPAIPPAPQAAQAHAPLHAPAVPRAPQAAQASATPHAPAVPSAPQAVQAHAPLAAPAPHQATHHPGYPALSPNQATQPGLQPWGSSATDPTQVSAPVTVGAPKQFQWRSWAAGAGAVMLLLMAIGAWQAVREQDAEPESESPAVTSPAADAEPSSAAARPKPLPRDDFNCSDGRCTCVAGARCTLDCPREGCELSCTKTRSCTLACGEACRARCVDAPESCEITLGNDGEASCEGSARCRVTCEGACEVLCPDGDCEVTCQGDSSREARRCDDTRVCGRDC